MYVVTVNNRPESRHASRADAYAAARRIQQTWGPLYVVRVEHQPERNAQ